MSQPTRIHPADVLSLGRLAVDATSGMVGVVGAMHGAIARTILPGTPVHTVMAGGAAATYGIIGVITSLLGGGIDAMLDPYRADIDNIQSSPQREALLALLNGVVGDHLVASGNPLAIPMRWRVNGLPLAPKTGAAGAALPQATGKLLVMVHGLCMNDLQWTRHGHNHGASLAAESGWTPVYLTYNSGLHVSTNGRAFAGLLEELIGQWPVPLREVAILCHSNGGLVARSAHYYGTASGHHWPRLLRRVVFLGTPHHGSGLERTGNWVNVLLGVSPYSSPLAAIAGIRSAGITDLRYGNILDEDWHGADRFRHAGDRRRPLALPAGLKCFAIAASRGVKLSCHLGDGLVSVDSALGRHHDPERALAFPKSHQWVGRGMSHWDLLSHPAVYRHIRKWLG
jgi:hypothetical protein